MSEEPKFETWAIVEVMGHHRFAGYVSEQQIGGAAMLRVDVPEIDNRSGFTKLLGIGSIYAITPCTEQVARHAGMRFAVRPFAMFDLPMLPSPSGVDDDYPDEDDDYADYLEPSTEVTKPGTAGPEEDDALSSK